MPCMAQASAKDVRDVLADAAPAGVCRRQDEGARHRGVSPLERKGEDAAERQSGHTRSVEPQLLDESSKATGAAIEAERFRRVG
jgi:hypothetical protein